MKRKLLSLSLLSFLLLPLCSCGYNDSFVVERSLKDELVDISFDEFKEKVENNDRFISLFYSEECYACDMLKNDFLEDFIKETHLKIYGIQVSREEVTSYVYIDQISSSLKKKNYTLDVNENNEQVLYLTYPQIMLIEEKEVISTALGTGGINKRYFNKNVYLDRNSTYYILAENDKISLKNSENPSFLKNDQYVENRIVYYTSSLTNNDEVNYYLKPFMEDYKYDIYYVEDHLLKENKLEVYKNGELYETTNNRANYLPLLDSYIKK